MSASHLTGLEMLEAGSLSAGGVAVGFVPLALSGVLIVCHVLVKLIPDLRGVVFLVPGHTLTRPWQVLTAGYFEDATLGLLVGLAALLGCGALLRSAWGDRELVRFVLVTNALQGAASWIGMIALYILFRSEQFLFAQLGGLTGVLGGLSVALAQHALRHPSAGVYLPMAMTPSGGMATPRLGRAGGAGGAVLAMRYAPSLCVAWAALVLLITHAGPPDELLFALNGILTGWIYLRYYQPRLGGACGDGSPAFEFACLLPPPLQPPARVIGTACFGIASSCGVFPPAGWAADCGPDGFATPAPVMPPELPTNLMPQTPVGVAPVTTSDPAVAERRRELARRLIEERIAAKAGLRGADASPASVPV